MAHFMIVSVYYVCYNNVTSVYHVRYYSGRGICMKKKLTKLTSIISAFAIMAMQLPVISYGAVVNGNLVGDFDPGFESRTVGTTLNNTAWGDGNWISRGTAVVVNDKAFSGSKSVKVTGKGSGPRAVLTNLKEGTSYYISAYVYTDEGGKSMQIGIGGGVSDFSKGVNVWSDKVSLTKGTWTKVCGVVKAPAAYDQAVNGTLSVSANSLYLNPVNEQWGDFWIDDFEIYETSPVPETEGNLLTNASFESAEDTSDNVGWRNSTGENAFTRVCSPFEAPHGNYYAQVKNRTTNWSAPKQIVAVQPDTYYYLGASVRLGTESASPIRAKTRMQSRTDGAVAVTDPYYGSDSGISFDEYKKIQKVVYNENATEAQVYVQTDETIATGNTGVDLWLDDFVVLPITSSIANGASDIIPNSSITLTVPETITVNTDTVKIDKGAEVLNVTRTGRECVVDLGGMINGVTYTLSLNTGLNTDCTPKWSFTTRVNQLSPWDPTFEAGFNTTKSDTEPYWHISGSTTVRSNEKAHSGSYSVKVTNRVGNYAGPQAQNIQVIAGNTYYVSVWVYTDSADKKAQLTFQGSSTTYRTGDMPLTKGEWTKISGKFTSDVVQSGKLFVQTSDSTDVFVDDFDLADITGTAPEIKAEGNLLQNAGFELGEKTHWRTNAPKYEIVRAPYEASSGIYAAKTTARDAAYATPQQYVNITPDTYYYVSAMARLANPATDTAMAKMRLQVEDGKTATNIPHDNHNKALNTDEYTKVSAVIYNTDSEYAKVYVNVSETEPYADLWTDDYAVIPFTSSVPNGATDVVPNTGITLTVPEDINVDTSTLTIDGGAVITGVQRNGIKCNVSFGGMTYGTEYTLTLKTGLNMNPTWKFSTAEGRLLTTNSGFELGVGSWTMPETDFYYTTKESKAAGDRSIKLVGRKKNYSTTHQYINAADMVNGNEYTISVWAKLAKGTSPMSLSYQIFDDSGASLGTTKIVTEDITTEWTHIQETFTFEEENFASIKIAGIVESLDDLYIDEFELWEGSKPETPTIQGSSQVITLSSDVSVNPAGITSVGKDIAQIWDFTCTPSTPGLLAGWRMRVGTLQGNGHFPFKPEYQDGITRLDIKISSSGYMATERYTDYNIDADKYKYISIKAQNLSHADTFQIGFWRTDNRTESKRIVRHIEWPETDGVQEIVIDMSKCSDWKGKISRVAFHPAKNCPTDELGWVIDGESVLLESISVFANSPAENSQLSGGVITSGEFVDMLIGSLELVSVESSGESNSIVAEETGIISSSEVFNPNLPITRERVAEMLKNACEYLDKQSDRYIELVEFSDESDFSDGMIEAASFVTGTGFMSAEGGNFNPQGQISAQEAQLAVNNMVSWINGTPGQGNIFISADTAGTYDIVRISAADPGRVSYTNAFDFNEVKADAVFTAPDGSTMILPGFYDTLADHGFDVRRIQSSISQDRGFWKFRFAPTMPGDWTFEIRLTYGGSEEFLGRGEITAVETGRPGYLRRDTNNPRFIYDNGDAFTGIGINLKAPVYEVDEGGYEIFEEYLEKYADDNGINLIRNWLNAEDDKNLEDYQTGLGRFNGVHAQRMDYVYGLARQKGVSVLTNVLSFHMLRSWNWLFSRGHYGSVKDGVIEYGAEFYSDAECIKAYKSLLRYMIARYSAYDNVLLWELLNEEEGIDGFNLNKESVSAWHDEMNAFVAETDPYGHPVGSSGYTISGEDFLFSKESTDYTILHSYDTVQPALILRANALIGTDKYNKPQIIEEMSLHAPDVTDLDPSGQSTHEILWSSLAAGHAAACPSWWWWPNEEFSEWGNEEGWSYHNEHWNIYGPVTSFLEGLNWPGENLKLVDFSATTSQTGDFIIPAGYKTYKQQLENGYVQGKKSFTFDLSSGKSNIRNVDDIIYESNLTNGDVYTFKINNLQKAANFVVTTVGKPTTAYTGGKLEIYVDPYKIGSLMLSQPKYSCDITDATLNEHIKKHIVSLSKGSHTVEVHYTTSNGNPCWLGWVGVEDVVPRVAAEGAVGDNNAVIFVRDTKAVYSEIIAEGYDNAVISDAKIDLDVSNLNDGRYRLIWWDTYQGGEVYREEFTISNGASSLTTVNVPEFTRDIAAKIIPIPVPVLSTEVQGVTVDNSLRKIVMTENVTYRYDDMETLANDIISDIDVKFEVNDNDGNGYFSDGDTLDVTVKATNDLYTYTVDVDTKINTEITSFTVGGETIDSGRTVTKIGEARLTYRVTNNMTSSISPIAVAVLYDVNNRLVDSSFTKSTSSVSKDGYVDLPLEINITETAKGGRLEILVWEDISNLSPLQRADKYIISVK